jgi:hypothetical protein
MAGVSQSIAPWTTRACADFLGFTPEWIRVAIVEGVSVHGCVVKLEAEAFTVGRRRTYRVHVDRFVAFLETIGWKRLPFIPTNSNN